MATAEKFPQLAEFVRGWRILLLAVMGIAISINAVLLYGFGALVGPFEQAFGWQRSDQQAAITFLYGGAVVGLQAVGWLNIRFGAKRVTIGSLLLMAVGYLSCIAWLGGSVWRLYVVFALLPIIGMGALATTWTQLIVSWFVYNRGLALAVGLSGTGITAALVPQLMTWTVAHYSWPGVFVGLALLNLAVMAVALIWFQLPEAAPLSRSESQQPEMVGGGLSFRQGLLSSRFWLCNLSLALVVSAIVGIVTNTIPMLLDRGFSAAEAAAIFGFFGLSLIAGRLVVGYLLDRFWPPLIASVSLFLPVIGYLIFLFGSQDVVMLAVAVALFGLGAGAEFDIAAFLIAKYFGIGDYTRLFGFHQGLITVASAAAPLLFAALYTWSGGYQWLLVYCLVSTAAGSLLLLALGRVPQFSHGTPPE